MSDSTKNRRPLKTRSWGVFQSLAAWLASTPISPNMISVSSIACGLVAGISLAFTAQTDSEFHQRLLWFLTVVAMQGRLIANLLDGMVAVEGGKASAVGDLYNEIPDRISDSFIFIGAGLALGSRLDLGLAAALVSVFVAYVRAIGASVGAGQVFMGPMAKPHRMALMTFVCGILVFLPSNWHWMHSESGIGWIGIALILITLGGIVTSARRILEIAKRMRDAASQHRAEASREEGSADV